MQPSGLGPDRPLEVICDPLSSGPMSSGNVCMPNRCGQRHDLMWDLTVGIAVRTARSRAGRVPHQVMVWQQGLGAKGSVAGAGVAGRQVSVKAKDMAGCCWLEVVAAKCVSRELSTCVLQGLKVMCCQAPTWEVGREGQAARKRQGQPGKRPHLGRDRI